MQRIVKLLDKRNVLQLIIFSITFFIYLSRISPGVYGGDSGDFIAAALTRGVPHPSGYPLYTMIGIIFTSLPIGMTAAWKYGLFSAIISSASIVILYLITFELTNNKYLSAVTALTLAFIYPFWIYAEIVEVFALNSFFMLLIIYLSVNFYNSEKEKYLYWLSFTLGLALTNNQVILLLIPATVFIILSTKWKVIKNLKLILRSLGLFIIGLLPYLYIPLAASQNPEISWGNAVTWENFYALVTRQLYGWGTSPSVASGGYKVGMNLFIQYWNTYMPITLLILAFLGLIYLIIKRKFTLLLYLMINFIILGPLFMIYTNPIFPNVIFKLSVVEKFIPQSTIFLIILSPFGILLLSDKLLDLLNNLLLKKIIVLTSYFSFLTVLISIFIVNYFRTDLSDIFLTDRFAKDILDTAPKDSLLLLEADQYIFNALYYQIAYDYRKDLKLPAAQSGFQSLIDLSPELASTIDEDYFVQRRNLIESDELIFATIIGTQEGDILINQGNTLIQTDNKVFIRVPYGLLEKLYLSNQDLPKKEEYYRQIDKIWESYDLERLYSENSVIDDSIILSDTRGIYIINLLSTAEFITNQYQDTEKAGEYYLKAFLIDPFYLTRME